MRSLASEVARQALRTPLDWGLQWYTADFREERSALDGGLLVRWTQHCCTSMLRRLCQRACWMYCVHRNRQRASNVTMQEHQTTFAVDCLRWLWSRHAAHGSSTDTPYVIVVGHSMGGVVARAAVAHLTAHHSSGALVSRSACVQRSPQALNVRKIQHHGVQAYQQCSRW